MLRGVREHALFYKLSIECLEQKNGVRRKVGVLERSAGARWCRTVCQYLKTIQRETTEKFFEGEGHSICLCKIFKKQE